MKNSLEDLRRMATEILKERKSEFETNVLGLDVKKLLEEISIYHIELEHQNKELERSENELGESRAEYIELFDMAPVGYVIIDKSHKIVRANKTFFELFVPHTSINRQSLEHRNFDEFICPEYKNAFSVFCKMIPKQKMPVPLELRIWDRQGSPHYVLITASAMQDGKNYNVAVSDIAMQKKLETQLVAAKNAAEEEDRKKSVFLTNVSHELRTPLQTIVGFGDMLRDKSLDYQTRKDYIDSIVVSSKILLELSNDVFDLSTLESGTAPLRYHVASVEKICGDAIRLINKKVHNANVLYTHDAKNIPAMLTDPLRLQQIILSVLSHIAGNATEGTVALSAKYTPTDENVGILSFRFSGSNIFSSENSLDANIQGQPMTKNCAGLGIYLAKKIVSIMKGHAIWEHPLDVLRIEIPVEKASEDDAKAVESTENDDGDEVSTTPTVPQKPCLIVDDVIMNLKVLSAIMKRLGYTPDMASSAKTALGLLEKNEYALILTDLWMPNMNGEEFAMIIRQNPKWSNIPIYAVTADIERKNNFNMEFFNATILKPVNIEKVKRSLALVNV